MDTKVMFVKQQTLEQMVNGAMQTISIPELSQAIATCLVAKAGAEQMIHDQNYRTPLGSTQFWLHLNPDGQIMLCYDRHPNEWDVQAIKDTIDSYERLRLSELGVQLY